MRAWKKNYGDLGLGRILRYGTKSANYKRKKMINMA